MRLRHRVSSLTALAVLGAAFHLATGGCARSDHPADSAPHETRKRVEVAEVAASEAQRTLRLSGTLRAVRRGRLAFPAGGRIAARPVGVGARVTAGQLLAKLDDTELRASRNGARADLVELEARRAQAEREQARAQRLAQAKAATAEELEQVSAGTQALVAAEDAARARERAAIQRLADSRLVAPFAGTVTAVFFESGEVASAGAPVVALSGDGALEVAVEAPESALATLEEGAAVIVHLPALSRGTAAGGDPDLAGHIRSIGRAASGSGRLFPVVVALELPPGSPAAAGMTAQVGLSLGRRSGLVVPVEAVVDPGGRRPSVFRLEETDQVPSAGAQEPRPYRVSRVEVDVGTLGAGGVTVSAQEGSLAAGDRVVVGGQRGLLDGEEVLVGSLDALAEAPGGEP